jgi:hypothetical protein
MDGAREDGRTKLVDDFGVGGGKGDGVVASVQIGGDARCRRRGTGEPRGERGWDAAKIFPLRKAKPWATLPMLTNSTNGPMTSFSSLRVYASIAKRSIWTAFGSGAGSMKGARR